MNINSTTKLVLLLAKSQQECKVFEIESKRLIASLHYELALKEREHSKEIQLQKTYAADAQKDANNAIEELQNLKRDFREVSDKLLCIICQEKDREVVNLPCKHLCMCLSCAYKTKKSKCPVCRQPIKGYLKFYL